MPRPHLTILALLLLALGLRLWLLTEIPPGLTHDEANHGREAVGVLAGDLRFYFPYNYGSEPLYSYTVAGLMGLLGENLLALRLVNVIFGVAAIAVTYLWSSRAFDRRVALLTAALMAVSFWPLATSRQALRAGMLPFFMAGAVWFFWQFLEEGVTDRPARRTGRILLFALCLAITLHIYLAARVAWLLFPAFLVYLAWRRRPLLHRAWRPTLLGLLVTAALVTPMALYLRQNPDVQPRVAMLDGPLQRLASGEFGPILRNAAQALLAFVWPGFGDQFLAYNIPGRPVFDPVTAVFFVAGLLVTLAYTVRSDHNRLASLAPTFTLLWFLIGISPSLVTGPTANTTRNLAALSPVYLLPAIGFVAIVDWLRRRNRRIGRTAVSIFALLWLALVAGNSARDYFVVWAQDPDVRAAYQVTQIRMLAELAAAGTAVTPGNPALISTVFPGPAHDPSIALVTYPALHLRWTDARHALVWPFGRPATAIIPASTPPHAAFAGWLQPVRTASMRPDDLDPAFTIYQLTAPPVDWLQAPPLANFGDAVTLQHASWLVDAVRPGETAVMLTAWRVLEPSRVGPRVPPADTTDVVIFTQVLAEGDVLAQRDALDAPSWDWQAGDLIVQLHPITVPAEAPPGRYEVITGIYDRVSGDRLPAVDAAGNAVETFSRVAPLNVVGGN